MWKRKAPNQCSVRQSICLQAIASLDIGMWHVVFPHIQSGDNDFQGANFFEEIPKVLFSFFPLYGTGSFACPLAYRALYIDCVGIIVPHFLNLVFARALDTAKCSAHTPEVSTAGKRIDTAKDTILRM
jgi:hypothetical protein